MIEVWAPRQERVRLRRPGQEDVAQDVHRATSHRRDRPAVHRRDRPDAGQRVEEDKGKIQVLVSFFGRETPVELDFAQVEKF